jgi:hypothetical protein
MKKQVMRKMDGIAWVDGGSKMELIWGERVEWSEKSYLSLFAYYLP